MQIKTTDEIALKEQKAFEKTKFSSLSTIDNSPYPFNSMKNLSQPAPNAIGQRNSKTIMYLSPKKRTEFSDSDDDQKDAAALQYD